MLKLKSGETTVIGGLIEHSVAINERGVPFFRKIPILGRLFKAQSEIQTVTETVILLKATIVDPNDSLNNSDKNFYKAFTTDPNPVF